MIWFSRNGEKHEKNYEEARTIALQTMREEAQRVFRATQAGKERHISGQYIDVDKTAFRCISCNCRSTVRTECGSRIATPLPGAYTRAAWEVGRWIVAQCMPVV
jgi:hypothetical protein